MVRADGDFLLGGLALKRLDGVVWLGVSLLEGNLFGEGLLSKTNVVVHLIYIILTYNQIQYHPPHDLLPPTAHPFHYHLTLIALYGHLYSYLER